MRIGDVISFAVIGILGFSGVSFSQECNEIDGFSSASRKFSVSRGEACEDYATISYNFRYHNGELTIEWGTSESYGNRKNAYDSNPIRLEGLEPNTTYYYKIWGIYKNRTHNLGASSFNTTGGEVPNEKPQITSANAVSCTTGTTAIYSITAEDPDGDDVTFSAEDLPGWIVLNEEALTFQPTAQSADTEVKILASDGKEGFDTLDLTVTVVQVTGIAANRKASEQTVALQFGESCFNVSGAQGEQFEIALYSLNGSKIIHRSLTVTEGMKFSGLLPEGVAPGVYLVRINGKAGVRAYSINIRR